MKTYHLNVPAEDLLVGDKIDLKFPDNLYSTATVTEVTKVCIVGKWHGKATMLRPYITTEPAGSHNYVVGTEKIEVIECKMGAKRLFSVTRYDYTVNN